MWPSELNASRIYDIANSVLLGSLAFGVLSTGLVIWMGKVKEWYSQKELEATRLKAGEANDRAAQADLKRVKLENRIADIFGPRQLTLAQSARIAKKLSGLKGTKIDVYAFAVGNPYTPNESLDSSNIALAVVKTLRDAHIDAEGWILGSCNGSGASNIVINVTGDSSDDQKIASKLIDAFRPEIGTYPEISGSPPSACTKFSDLDGARPNRRKHDATISITIGRKISPLLTPEMLEPVDEPENP